MASTVTRYVYSPLVNPIFVFTSYTADDRYEGYAQTHQTIISSRAGAIMSGKETPSSNDDGLMENNDPTDEIPLTGDRRQRELFEAYLNSKNTWFLLKIHG